MLMDDESDSYAVRWAQRYYRRYSLPDRVQWTKWHWTDDSNVTLCGHQIILLRDNCPMLPQTSDDAGQVECVHCRRKLGLS